MPVETSDLSSQQCELNTAIANVLVQLECSQVLTPLYEWGADLASQAYTPLRVELMACPSHILPAGTPRS